MAFVRQFLNDFTRLAAKETCFITRTARSKAPVRHFSVSALRRSSVVKAAVLKEFTKPLLIDQVTLPEKLKKNEVRIEVSHCGVNNTDALLCAGLYDSKLKLPTIPGFEVAGLVTSVGEGVSEIKPGDRVVGLNKQLFGGFAEICALEQTDVWKLPTNVTFETAVAIVDSYTTAYLALAKRAKLNEGDTVLVTAAAGGLGLAAVDLAANVYKAKVIGVCGTEDKADLVRGMGAFAAMTYDRKNLLATVKDVSQGQGIKIIFDGVGGEIFNDCIECIAHEGTLIVAGFASRQIPNIKTSQLMTRSISLMGVSLTSMRNMAPDQYHAVVQDVVEMASEELFDPYISGRYHFDQVNEALQFLTDRKSVGKVILSVKE